MAQLIDQLSLRRALIEALVQALMHALIQALMHALIQALMLASWECCCCNWFRAQHSAGVPVLHWLHPPSHR